MKKQILFLVVFVLATFAGVNKSYGQGTPLAPTPGSPQVYNVVATPAGGTFAWSIFEDGTDLLNGTPLTSGTDFTASASGGDYTVTWNPSAVGRTFYVVSKYTYTPTSPTGCDIMNMRVFEVKPVNSFVLTVTLATSTGALNTVSDVCPPAIVSAAIEGTNVKMNYGVTTLYYEVKAEGMVGNWKPSIRIPDLVAGQTYGTVTFNGTDMGAANTAAQQDLTLASDLAVDVDGEEYLVVITINHNAANPTTAQTISLEADGLLASGYTVSDIIGGGNTTPAGAFGSATVKKAEYSIVARPAMTTTPGSMPIVP